MERHALILDVDTGIDDSLALLYACADPAIDLVAVTCCGGNVEAEQVHANTRGLLELLGRNEVPVALGRRRPIARPLETTPETHGPTGTGYATLPAPTTPALDTDGVELLVELARSRPGELTLVNLGPLTNLAAAVLMEPRLPELLRSVSIMGGAFSSNGNTAPRTEWNVHVDPEAAKVVYAAWAASSGRHPLPVVMGLDVTERAVLLPRHLRELAARRGSVGAPAGDDEAFMGARFDDPLLRYVIDALRFYFEFHARYDGFYGAFIHDPFVVAAANDPGLVTTRPVFLDVELGGTLTTGEVVADWRDRWGRDPNAEVAVDGDADRFLDRLLELAAGYATG